MKKNYLASFRRYLGLGVRLLGVAIAVAATSANAALVNQYTFNTDGSDSVGGADATLHGTATISGGQLNLLGGGGFASYASLPAGVASTAASTGVSGEISTESWVTINNNNDWSVIFSFGNSGPNTTDGGAGDGAYWQLIPRAGNSQLLRTTTHIDGSEAPPIDGASALATGSLQQLVDVIDLANDSHKLYLNGTLVASGVLQAGFNPNIYNPVGDSQNWIGQSQWPDSSLDGSIDLFRIYNTALSAQDVADSFAAGPSAGVPEPTSLALFGLGCLGLGLGYKRRK